MNNVSDLNLHSMTKLSAGFAAAHRMTQASGEGIECFSKIEVEDVSLDVFAQKFSNGM